MVSIKYENWLEVYQNTIVISNGIDEERQNCCLFTNKSQFMILYCSFSIFTSYTLPITLTRQLEQILIVLDQHGHINSFWFPLTQTCFSNIFSFKTDVYECLCLDIYTAYDYTKS